MPSSTSGSLAAAVARALDLVMPDVKMSMSARRLGGDIAVVDIARVIRGTPPGVEELRNVVYAPRVDLKTIAAQANLSALRSACAAQRTFYVDSSLLMPGTAALPLRLARSTGVRETTPAPTGAKHEIVVTVVGLSDDANEVVARLVAASVHYKLLSLPTL